tara:strand:- start:17396 stop:17563 length:168 start_codon:yes stop_codon:yes gene_type:complete
MTNERKIEVMDELSLMRKKMKNVMDSEFKIIKEAKKNIDTIDELLINLRGNNKKN